MPDHAMLWAPRLLAFAVGLFVAAFSLDALGTFPDFAIHLIPAATIFAVIAVSWRREWFGAVAFACMAAGYAVVARERPDWIVVIAGPLLLVGVAYTWSWYRRRGSGW